MASTSPFQRRLRNPLRRQTDFGERRFRRGVYIIPSLFTLGNMFCGYACVIYAMRGEYEKAAPFVGIAIVLDMLDGRIARLTKTSSAFGLELDSLADIISFGIAPAVLAFAWGLSDLGRVGWAAGFLYLTAAAMRLARFNLQTAGQVDKRYFVGMPSPPAAGVVAATIFARSCSVAASSAAQRPRAGVPDRRPEPQSAGERAGVRDAASEYQHRAGGSPRPERAWCTGRRRRRLPQRPASG